MLGISKVIPKENKNRVKESDLIIHKFKKTGIYKTLGLYTIFIHYYTKEINYSDNNSNNDSDNNSIRR